MKFLMFLFFTATLLVDHVKPANILVISFFSTKSHKLTYLPLVEELANRGHNITMVSPVKPMKEVKNIKEIFTMDVDKLIHTGANKIDAFGSKEKGSALGPSPIEMINLILQSCEMTYDLPQVKALLHEKFDLIFLQPLFNDCALGLIHRLKAPLVLFTPISVPSFIGYKLGAHFPSSITPNFLLGYNQEMTFKERFINFGVDTLKDSLVKFYYEPRAAKIYREKLGEDLPSVDDILGNASLVLSNGHFSLTGAKPYFPDVVDVGGIHSKPAKPVPKDLEDFIKKGKDGFILFSMGSAIKGDQMPDAKRKMILNVFSKLKQQVLWKWESETMPGLSENVKLSKWLPQQDLLGHKDCKMFITHCGGGSTEEAIYHGVPLVGVPMIADQSQNAGLAKRNGLLIELDWNTLTEKELEDAINEILTNPKYRENAKKLSTLFKDRPQKPMELGVYWIEYVLRHHGAPHLRNAGRKLNAIQYHSIDVMAAYLAIIATVLYLVFFILRFIIRKIRSCLQTRKYSSFDSGKKSK